MPWRWPWQTREDPLLVQLNDVLFQSSRIRSQLEADRDRTDRVVKKIHEIARGEDE